MMMIQNKIFSIAWMALLCLSTRAQIPLNDLYILSSNTMMEFKDDLWIFGSGQSKGSKKSLYNVLRSKDNGDTWEIMVHVSDASNYLNDYSKTILFKDKLYSIAGHPSSFTNEIKTSTDGISWDSYTPPFAPRKAHAVLVHNDKLFVIAGAGRNDVWYTEDGRKWIQATSRLSTDFPHFWRNRVVSLNGKLILFGGDKSDWGTTSNERGVYISEDDGYTWTRHEFPFSVNLDHSNTYFVYQNKLWIIARVNTNIDNPFNWNVTRGQKRFFTTTDGINWQLEPNRDAPLIQNDDVLMKIVTYRNEIYSFAEAYKGDARNVRAKFELPPFELPGIGNIRTDGTESLQKRIPFAVRHKDSDFLGHFSYEFVSSNEEIVQREGLRFENDEILLTATGKIGLTQITVKVSDGVEYQHEKFEFFMSPNKKIYILPNIPNTIVAEAEDELLFAMIYAYADTPPEKPFTVTSSNTDFILPGDLSILYFPLERLRIGNFAEKKSGEAQITITANAGGTSYSTSFWVKKGTDDTPVAMGTLQNYVWDTSENFNYDLPNTAFFDPERVPLNYYSDNLPQGLCMDNKTGRITGTPPNETFPFTINIIASDRYGKDANHELTVELHSLAPSLSKTTIAENQEVGTLVGIFSLTDTDSNNDVTYSFTSGNTTSFTIRGDSLFTNEMFDFETKSDYTFQISITDTAGDTISSREFTIHILNANDAPENPSLSKTTIAENQEVGTLVGIFSLTDTDSSNDVTYSFTSGNTTSFTIRGDSLFTNEMFDFETKSDYTFEISITDTAGDTISSREFTIHILNANDAPENPLIIHSEFLQLPYPNPVSQQLSVVLDEQVIYTPTVSVYSLNGQLMEEISHTVSDNILKLQVSNLPSGLYILKVAYGTHLLRTRFVKQ